VRREAAGWAIEDFDFAHDPRALIPNGPQGDITAASASFGLSSAASPLSDA